MPDDRRDLARFLPRGRLFAALAATAVLAGALAGVVAAQGPFFFLSCDPDGLFERPLGKSSYVFAADGSLLATIAPEAQSRPVPLERMSPLVREAAIAIEDRRFYEHEGIDYRGIARALLADVGEGSAIQGGSTITQQLARDLYLDRERSLSRKLAEGCVAVELDRRWTKERILAAYLNRAYFGNKAYGVEAAARTYFSKPAAKLELHEAALLAGLVQAPSRLDPLRRPEDARARRDAVLAAMRETGAISAGEEAAARRRELGLRPSPAFGRQREAFLANTVLEQLVEVYGADAVRRGGFAVRTTIDKRLQLLAREAIESTLDREGDPASAVVAVDPRTGAIRAMVVADPSRATVGFNVAAEGRRQAGSTFKTFVLAEAVRRGIDPWRTAYLSAPFSGRIGGGPAWEVETYDGTYLGRASIAAATLRSDNTVYARLTLDLGPPRVADTARALGIRSELPKVPSIGLGAASVSALELAAAYATLAAGGVRAEPLLIQRVKRPDGRVDGRKPERARALPDGVAYEVTRILERNVEAGTGTGAAIGRPAAGKTGTTDDYADAWFAGYTPQLAAAVWVGYADEARPMRDVHGVAVSGGTFPATIWSRFMAPAHEPLPVQDWTAPAQPVAFERFCGRFQLARTAADARPQAGCPAKRKPVKRAKPKPKPQPRRAAATEQATTTAAPQQPPAGGTVPRETQPATTAAEEDEAPPVAEPTEELIGRRGVVRTAIPELTAGEIEVERVLYPAVGEGGAAIPAGAEVEVVAVEDGAAVVRPTGKRRRV